MTRAADVIRGWLGWCPFAAALCIDPAPRIAVQETASPDRPDGNPQRPWRIDRGVDIALGSIRILIRNKRLLWFALLNGLVMAFTLATSLYLQIVSGTNPVPGSGLIGDPVEVLVPKGSPLLLALTFSTQFASAVCTYCLLAGLILCVAAASSGKVTTIREGFSGAVRHIRALLCWAAIVAGVGTVQVSITGLYYGDYPVMFGSASAGFVFYALMLFVVPALVVGHEDLAAAVAGSLSAFRKAWAEIVVCFAVFLLIAFLATMALLIPVIAAGFSSGSTALAATVVVGIYLLAMLCIVVVGSAVTGIATFGLYACARTDRLPAGFVVP